uniref:IMD domain-containing protein n=1 Tax=Astyanax mexicanus TaxID=7994 RepID=A0A8B9R9Y1_ASTMX
MSNSDSLCSAGDVLFQMAEVHRQIQVQLEEMVRYLPHLLLISSSVPCRLYISIIKSSIDFHTARV